MRFKIWLRRLFTAGALLATPCMALAWSNQGHMVTGAIAYDDLAKADPALVARVESIMASHPDKTRFDRALTGYAGEARSRRLFELMARWPDDARGGPYDHPAWHYWLRLIPSVSDPIHLPAALSGLTTGEAREAYQLSLATARDGFAPPSERAVALCWLFHLAGDIQQPLHAGTLVSGRFPLSDRAGESDMVRPAGGHDINLHEYWDNAIGGDEDDDANVEAMRVHLEALWPRSALAELNGAAGAEAFRGWADESYELARSVVYDKGQFEGTTNTIAAVPVSAAYEAVRRGLGERRVALGGHRIADAVRESLGRPASVSPPAKKPELIQ
jgi:hypothetical protein